MPIFSTLFAIRVDKCHRYCTMEWACRWCQIVKRYTSLHELILTIHFYKLYKWVETQTTNQRLSFESPLHFFTLLANFNDVLFMLLIIWYSLLPFPLCLLQVMVFEFHHPRNSYSIDFIDKPILNLPTAL